VVTKLIYLYSSCPCTLVLYNWHCKGRCNRCRGIWFNQFSQVCSWDTLSSHTMGLVRALINWRLKTVLSFHSVL